MDSNRFTKLPINGTLQKKFSSYTKYISQGSHRNCCTERKRIYLQRINPYQLPRSLHRQQAPAFLILKMPSCGFNIHYTLQLHLKYPCQVKPHKVYHHRTILQLVHCMQNSTLAKPNHINYQDVFFSKILLYFVFSTYIADDSTLHYTLLILRSISMNESSHTKTTVIVEYWKHTIPFRDKN